MRNDSWAFSSKLKNSSRNKTHCQKDLCYFKEIFLLYKIVCFDFFNFTDLCVFSNHKINCQKLTKLGISDTFFPFFLHLLEVLRPSKLLVKFVLCMRKEQCLKVLPAIGFWALKGTFNFRNGSYTGRPIEFDKEQLNIFFMKINIKRLEQIKWDKRTV